MNNFFNVAAVCDRRWLSCLVFISAGALASLNAQTNAASTSPTTNVAADTAPQTDPFDDPLIKQIQARHDKAVKGDTKETKALTTDLEKLTQDQPTNFLLQAYLGSVYTLDSRDAWPGPGKLTYLKKGGQWLDGAVNSDPENPAVRFIRAMPSQASTSISSQWFNLASSLQSAAIS